MCFVPPQADTNNYVIRRIDLNTRLVTTLACFFAGERGFDLPYGVAIDSSGSFALVVRS